jgi:Xaa-Pro aminopeptidase
MRTMQPCVTIGSYTWAQERLPYDEFTLRLEELHAAMDRNGWPAMLVYGDVREHAALAYLSNFIPRVRWGMALLPRSGDARLLCAMSTRDLPAMRTLTWISDVRSGMGPEWQKNFDPWFEPLKAERTVELGTIGFDIMAPVLHQVAQRGLGERFVLRRADDDLAVPPPHKRPRELTMLRASCKLLQSAAQAFAQSWRECSAPETAALDAERLARSRAAQDVRILVSLDGGRTLVPYEGAFEKKAGPLVAYLAVKVMGYWADMLITMDEGVSQALQKTEATLDALIAAVRPGARAGDLHAEAIGALAPLPLHPVLSASVGHGIGLSLNEQPEFRAGETSELVADGVYTLQVGVADAQAGNALLSAVIRCTVKGAEVLVRPSLTGASTSRRPSKHRQS